jgi:hypothetical protein
MKFIHSVGKLQLFIIVAYGTCIFEELTSWPYRLILLFINVSSKAFYL